MDSERERELETVLKLCADTLQYADDKLREWAGIPYIKRPLRKQMSDTADALRAAVKQAHRVLAKEPR